MPGPHVEDRLRDIYKIKFRYYKLLLSYRTQAAKLMLNHKKNLFIPGPEGNLETVIEFAADAVDTTTIAVICHPHPLYGGTMENKVVTTLARTFRELNITSVRFNFRGVGQSVGAYADGVGESKDLLAILDWLSQEYPTAEFILAGFSFGSYVATRVASQRPAQQLITVAPPVTNFDFTALEIPSCPWLLIQGTADEVIAADAVFAWFKQHVQHYDLMVLEHASHFFHGRLVELKERLLEYYKK